MKFQWDGIDGGIAHYLDKRNEIQIGTSGLSDAEACLSVVEMDSLAEAWLKARKVQTDVCDFTAKPVQITPYPGYDAIFVLLDDGRIFLQAVGGKFGEEVKGPWCA